MMSDRTNFILYPSLVFPTPTEPETPVVTKWFQPFSEPVRFRIDPKRKVTIDSWLYRLVPAAPFQETIFEDKWHYSWSEPVRFKRIHTSQIVSGLTWDPQPIPFQWWYTPLSEPVRIKPGLKVALQRFNTQDTDFIPKPQTFMAWFSWLTEPVRLKKGLRAHYHYPYFAPPRALPTPNITMTLSVTESQDTALFGIDVFGIPTPSRAGASVVITEIPVQDDGAISIREP